MRILSDSSNKVIRQYPKKTAPSAVNTIYKNPGTSYSQPQTPAALSNTAQPVKEAPSHREAQARKVDSKQKIALLYLPGNARNNHPVQDVTKSSILKPL